jgi:hypothetical protein
VTHYSTYSAENLEVNKKFLCEYFSEGSTVKRGGLGVRVFALLRWLIQILASWAIYLAREKYLLVTQAMARAMVMSQTLTRPTPGSFDVP